MGDQYEQFGEAAPEGDFGSLFADGADVAAARVFVEVFSPGGKPVQPFKAVRSAAATVGRVTQRSRFITTNAMAEPAYAAGLEIVLLWEWAFLAARIPSGDQGTLVVLLRQGHRARESADPYAAALATLRTPGRG